MVHPARIRVLNEAAAPRKADYVLYWSQMNRRADANQSLAHAIELANAAGLPVLFYEGLTCSYPWANDRLHTFMLEGVPDSARRLAEMGIGYLFYMRRRQSDPNDVLYRLAKHAAAVVTDDYPTFIAARHNRSVAPKIGIPYVAVDASCVVPMSCFPKREWAAYTIRPKIHRLLGEHLRPVNMPRVRQKWTGKIPRFHTDVTAERIPKLVAACEIDHSIAPSESVRGGRSEALRRLRHFIHQRLPRYAAEARQPSAHATSDLSPYLHFGCISATEIALAAQKAGHATEFLEELIVRRELAFNFSRSVENPASLDNLPDWAQRTLAEHARDEREVVYTRDQFAAARTHDPLWNATQREMLRHGKIHGYYRMYWGKKIIEWSKTHQEALDTMVYIHDRWALDGRDPNTYTNILWCFGLHDRPWSERPVFGSVRFMSAEGMRRKTDVDAYMREVGGSEA